MDSITILAAVIAMAVGAAMAIAIPLWFASTPALNKGRNG